ncbi:ADENINE NUCLEOTIDE ALPHA HYDROLASES-LIKE SUPERFAMILY PROTEIN [Salix viminalis]|uniref:ADENINE NUCLEOTIDE ALPHA HYDROLASES-LIKE SUPERFAMILY PROTEIN n=1 Tax=Salix viminalis TaxID=40686 RepID=A0A9Q0NMY0_SALVM|nr:ADENINE NUCLEOTIDE ALPHA HYDROLASES-LIKE SUPERFAMILY PROTEIN [Salix viminalis]
MDVRKIVVVVEDVDEARAALKWALHNLLRYGDLITLLHVFSPAMNSPRCKNKTRLLRLEGYQLALSFKDILCNSFNTNVEIIVTEGDQEGGKIAAMVREIGASALVAGLHDRSFLYKLAMAHNGIANSLRCRVLAIKPPAMPPARSARTRTRAAPPPDISASMDFSQIETGRQLEVPEMAPPKVPYKICPDPSAIIWRSRKSKRRGGGSCINI